MVINLTVKTNWKKNSEDSIFIFTNRTSMCNEQCIYGVWCWFVSWRKSLPAFSINTVSKNLMLTGIYWTNAFTPINGKLIAVLPALMQKTISIKWCRMSELKNNMNNTFFLMLRMTCFQDLVHYLAFSEEHNISQTESVFILMWKCREVSAQHGLTDKQLSSITESIIFTIVT